MRIPTLTVLIGLPGSTKTTYAEALAEQTGALRISSDEMREQLYGDEMDQGHNSELFEIIHQAIKSGLECKEDVIFDATNITRKHRRSLNRFLAGVPCHKKAVVVARPYESCIVLNKQRGRVVPEQVILRMMKQFQFPCAEDEGYDEVEVYYPNPEDKTKYGNPKDIFQAYMNFDQCNHHHKDTLGMHLYNTFSAVAARSHDTALLQAAALHDCGKPECMVFQDNKRQPTKEAHYYGHECVSSYQSMFYDIEDRVQVPLLISYHMYPYQWKDKETREKFKKKLGVDLYMKLMILHEADGGAH